jgi:hypothetical protein
MAAKVEADNIEEITDTQRALLHELGTAHEAVIQLKQDAAKAVETRSHLVDTKLSEMETREKALGEHWSDLLNTSQSQIEALKNQIHETNALQTATHVWKQKQTRHRVTFGFGLAGLGIVVVGLITFFLFEVPDLFARLPRKTPDNDIPYGVVALCFVPIIAIGWILRIVGRWVTNALTLSEDAEQRRAMLDTYFSLVGDPNAKMEETDRILILNAIFRPLPGYQTEDVAPPTLLDLARDAVGKR